VNSQSVVSPGRELTITAFPPGLVKVN